MPVDLKTIVSLVLTFLMVLPQLPGAAADLILVPIAQRADQRSRVETMRGGNIPLVDEQSFADFNLNEPGLRYNQIRTLTTHNSYKKALSERLYAVALPFTGEDLLRGVHYEHDTPSNQLTAGIRGLEMDVRFQLNGFRVFHGPQFDNDSSAPDWTLLLEELRLWSQANPDHVPVTILVEMKDDPPLANPLYRKMTPARFAAMDKSIRTVLGEDYLVTPAQLMGSYPSLGAMRAQNDWPLLSELRGRYIFLLHSHNEYTDMYLGMDDSLRTQAMVPAFGSNAAGRYPDSAAFLLNNDPHVGTIRSFVDAGYVVRTRMDTGLNYNPSRKADAIASGAQLLTTDLEEGLILPHSDYAAFLRDRYTIILN